MRLPREVGALGDQEPRELMASDELRIHLGTVPQESQGRKHLILCKITALDLTRAGSSPTEAVVLAAAPGYGVAFRRET